MLNPLVKALRAKARRRFSAIPQVYLPYRERRKPGTTVNEKTDLIIEGYPRCGNTWTENVVRFCSDDQLSLAHHSHSIANIKRAAQLKVPTIVVFRDPVDAVRSLLVLRGDAYCAKEAFDDFTFFYRNAMLLPKSYLFFASFEDVTQRTSELVHSLRMRFGLPLQSYHESDKSGVFALMDERAKRRRNDQVAQSRCNPNHYGQEQSEAKKRADEAIASPKCKASKEAAYAALRMLQSDVGVYLA